MTDVDYRSMYLKVRDELAELQQRKQEPVAWIAEGSGNLHWDKVEALVDSDGWITPLYREKNT